MLESLNAFLTPSEETPPAPTLEDNLNEYGIDINEFYEWANGEGAEYLDDTGWDSNMGSEGDSE